MLVTPGYLPADNTKITPAQLRAIAAPSVALEANDVNETNADITRLSNAMQISAGKVNYLTNPNFTPVNWPKGAGPIICTSGIYTALANGWEVKPSAGRVTQQQSTQVTTASIDTAKSLYSLQVLGDTTSTGTVQIKQDILQYLAASLRYTGMFSVSFYLYNGTGSSITPTLIFSTPTSTADDFTSVTQQSTSSCGACANATWTKVTVQAIDATAWSNVDKGLRVALQLPSACLNAPGKSVFFHQAKVELVAATEFLPTTEIVTQPNENYFTNGNFDLWASTNATAITGNATKWFGPMTRSTDHALAGSSYTAKIVGTAAAIDYGQVVTGHETQQSLTFSCWLYNSSSAEVTPALRVDLVTGAANQLSVSLQPCAIGVWTKLNYTIPAGGYTVDAAGLSVYLRITLGSTQTSYLAQMKLEPGPVPTRMRRGNEAAAVPQMVGYKNLKIDTNGGSATVKVSADYVIMRSDTGQFLLSQTTNGGGAATNTLYEVISVVAGSRAGGLDYATPMTSAVWHYVYAIADKDGFTRAILSKSATAPTLPSGYIYYLLLGAVMPDSTTTIPAYFQNDNNCYCLRQTGTGGWLGTVTGVTSDYTFVDVSAIVPPIAKTVQGIAGVTSAVAFGWEINSWGMAGTGVEGPGIQIITGASTTSAHGDGVYFGCGRFSIGYLSPDLGWKTSDTTANKRSDITGWTL